MPVDAPPPGWLWAPPANRAPGWRRDPDDPRLQRWWTGVSWSPMTQPPPGTRNRWLEAATVSGMAGIVSLVAALVFSSVVAAGWAFAILAAIGIGATPILSGIAIAVHRRHGHRNSAEILFWLSTILIAMGVLSALTGIMMSMAHSGR